MDNQLDHATFIRRAHRFFIYFGGIYACFMVLLTIPTFQAHLIYLHKLKWPLFPDFSHPEKYGLAPHRVANLNITTSDNVNLGAWFLLSDTYYSSSYASPAAPSQKPSNPLSDASISSALRLFPTILYLHGNAGTRAVGFRIDTYAAYTTRLGANVLAIDYRGYADSEGSPTEEGLNLDAHAAWKWLVNHGADPEDIVIFGQSLGTGVASKLAEDLSAQGVKSRGLVLVAPFSSLAKLLETYNFGGWLPLLKPLQGVPFLQQFVLKFLKSKFDTLNTLPSVNTNIVLIHAENDLDIIPSHSTALFDNLLEPSLPPPTITIEEFKNPLALTPERWEEFRDTQAMRQRVREDIVHIEEIKDFGKVSQFKRSETGSKVVFVETKWGGHDSVGRAEGVVDIMGNVLGIKRVC
ncbi:hypothetical protein M422DRAFT_200744 [Sphaerobolus stellatus SS14]|nr:hypothetical protein M422DRAFT_200744 [Sphaerobolus stellatus SS14]